MGLEMHLQVIQKIAKQHRPKVVVEVGLKFATTLLMPIFKRYGATRYIGIDPVARYQCPAEYAGFFEYRQEYSLDALPAISEADLVMLDGDHTYYTVMNELQLLHRILKPGMVILLHDVEEPWARKDLYYNKDLIPPEFVDGDKQGVLTAVEDFLQEKSSDYSPLKIFSGGNGLGYIVRNGSRTSQTWCDLLPTLFRTRN
jgi:cephalosporin hydroxylase